MDGINAEYWKYERSFLHLRLVDKFLLAGNKEKFMRTKNESDSDFKKGLNKVYQIYSKISKSRLKILTENILARFKQGCSLQLVLLLY